MKTETVKLKPYARASTYLVLFFTCVTISALLPSAQEEHFDENIPSLLLKGWNKMNSLPCENLQQGYYQAQTEDFSGEFYVSNRTESFSKIETWPSENITCSKIIAPSFVEEI